MEKLERRGRLALGLSVRGLAKLAGCSPSLVYALENGGMQGGAAAERVRKVLLELAVERLEAAKGRGEHLRMIAAATMGEPGILDIYPAKPPIADMT